MSADESGVAVDHDDLAVIARVDLATIGAVAVGGETGNFNTAVTQLLKEASIRLVAADLVIEEVDGDTAPDRPQKAIAEALSQPVVAEDVELDQNVVLCRFDP